MPDIVMHHFFGKSVLDQLPDTCKEKITNIELFDFATLGPDIFFFLDFFISKKGKKNYQFGLKMHEEKTQYFLKKMVELSKQYPDLFSYLAGFITHYYLDSIAHPFILYHTGEYRKSDYTTHIYRGLHNRLEKGMDIYVIENHYDAKPYRFSISKEILKLKKIPKILQTPVDALFFEVYQMKNAYQKLNRAIRHERFFYRLTFDPYGWKNRLFSWLDKKENEIDWKVLSYHNKRIEGLDYFNFRKAYWTHPIAGERLSNKSYWELFDDAILQASKTIEQFEKAIFDQEDLDFETLIPNISYRTGLDCANKEIVQNVKNIFS